MGSVGQRIRQIRTANGWTLKHLSAACGLSAGFLSQVERGLSSLSLVSLRAISEALGVSSIDLLMKEENLQPDESVSISPVTRAAEQLHIKIGEYPIRYLYLSGEFPNRIIEVMINEFPPSYQHPLAPHKGEEFGYVLEGMMVLKIGQEEYSLKPGDSYHFQASRPHGYQAGKDKGSRVLMVTTQSMLEVHNLRHILQSRTP